MKKIVWLYFFCALLLPHMASATDLYLFFINGDAKYDYKGCKNGEISCKEKVIGDASETFLKKAKEFSKTCRDCDVVIFHVKPYTETKEYYVQERFGTTFGGAKYSVVPEEYVNPDKHKKVSKKVERSGRVLFYSNGDIVNELPLIISRDSLGNIPKIGPILSLIRRSTDFSRELKKIDESKFFQSTYYNKQFAFFFSHNIPEDSSREFFQSNKEAKFSIDAALDFIRGFSKISNNGEDRPLDALFLFSCAVGLSTVSKIYNENTTDLLIAHPTLVPLETLVSWDLLSLREHLSSNKDTYESIKTFLDKSFSPEEENYKESLMPVISADYAVSIYNLRYISFDMVLQKALKEGEKISRKISKRIADGLRERASGESAGKLGIGQVVTGRSLKEEINCGVHPEMQSTLKNLEPSLDKYFFQGKSIRSIFHKQKKKVRDFSGWSCLF